MCMYGHMCEQVNTDMHVYEYTGIHGHMCMCTGLDGYIDYVQLCTNVRGCVQGCLGMHECVCVCTVYLVTQMSVCSGMQRHMQVCLCTGVQAHTGRQCIVQMCTNAVSTLHLGSSSVHKVTSKSCRGG